MPIELGKKKRENNGLELLVNRYMNSAYVSTIRKIDRRTAGIAELCYQGKMNDLYNAFESLPECITKQLATYPAFPSAEDQPFLEKLVVDMKEHLGLMDFRFLMV